jgi:hypothetical protein
VISARRRPPPRSAPRPSWRRARCRQAAGLSGLGILPLGERLSVFGRLGLLQTRTQSKATGAVTAESNLERVNDSKIDLGSLGVQYQF